MKHATRGDAAQREMKLRRAAKAHSKAKRNHNGRVDHRGKLDPNGVLPWRLDHAARLARQLVQPTIPGNSRQMRRLMKRRAWRPDRGVFAVPVEQVEPAK